MILYFTDSPKNQYHKAQTSYFFMLCMIPIILLLLTMVQYTPVTKADVMTAVIQVFPSSVDSLITSIVNQVYNQSTGVIPITIVVALWSAGKGVLAMTSGLNSASPRRSISAGWRWDVEQPRTEKLCSWLTAQFFCRDSPYRHRSYITTASPVWNRTGGMWCLWWLSIFREPLNKWH